MPRPTHELVDVFAKALAEIEYEKTLQKQAYPFVPEWTEEGRDSSSVFLKDDEPLYNLQHPNLGYGEDSSITNIVDRAHPAPVIIHPSYDKINGLFENLNERSAIMSNLALDKPVGLLAFDKYASQELTLELIKIANEMDASDQEDIFKLADECLAQMKKEALFPLVIGLTAAALGAVWLANNTTGSSKGLFNDCNIAIRALREAEKIGTFEGEIDTYLKGSVDMAISKIEQFEKDASVFYKMVDEINMPRTNEGTQQYMSELSKVMQNGGDDLGHAYHDFRAKVQDLDTYLGKLIENLSSDSYVNQHKKTTWLEENTGFLSDILTGNKGVLSNDFAKAAHALETLKKSMAELANKVIDSEKVVKEKQEELANTQKAMTVAPAKPETVSTPSSSANAGAYKNPFEDADFKSKDNQ